MYPHRFLNTRLQTQYQLKVTRTLSHNGEYNLGAEMDMLRQALGNKSGDNDDKHFEDYTEIDRAGDQMANISALGLERLDKGTTRTGGHQRPCGLMQVVPANLIAASSKGKEKMVNTIAVDQTNL